MFVSVGRAETLRFTRSEMGSLLCLACVAQFRAFRDKARHFGKRAADAAAAAAAAATTATTTTAATSRKDFLKFTCIPNQLLW